MTRILPVNGPWRHPGQESIGLYPGLVVHDDRVSGSITFGRSRLPLWAVVGELFHGSGWDGVEEGWEPSRYGWDEGRFGDFIYELLELRGEFARLLLVLADAERCDRHIGRGAPWWATKRHRKRVGDQLRRCLVALEGPAQVTGG